MASLCDKASDRNHYCALIPVLCLDPRLREDCEVIGQTVRVPAFPGGDLSGTISASQAFFA
jgi:hypothetical protein